MSETNDSTIASYLKSNPRMIGVLFTMTMLLAQAGAAAAGNAVNVGP